MKRLEENELEMLIGGGCKKHLRRYHRAMKNKEEDKSLTHILAYADCMDIQ